ncbi:MAG: transcriptional activator NhaR [Myxococcales bacterium]|nr:transcriptional activator NhaR [Myxococcales bacterium]
MNWLNYHHLLYFWVAVREGSITAAAAKLRLSQPTVSAQIRSLEEALGEKLFRRTGRDLELTEIGKLTFKYAEEIFTIGEELKDVLAGRAGHRAERLVIGVSDLVPKLLVHRLIAPALAMEDPPRITCREDKTDRLLAELALHDLDLVLGETPIAGQASVRAFNHPLGECGVTFFGTPPLARAYSEGFPESLDGAPLLAPTQNALLRRSLDRWFEELEIRPIVIADFEDSALLKAFGAEGVGVFPGPSAIANEISDMYGVRVVGSTTAVMERFYAISVERRIKHPAVRVIKENARRFLL